MAMCLRAHLRVALVLALTGTCGNAFANVGVPPLTNTWFTLVLWLIPIVAIEAVVLKQQLPISARSAAGAAILANLASTAAGFLFVLVDETYLSIPFLPVRVTVGTITDLVTLGLFIPFFLASVAIEYPVCRVLKRTIDVGRMRRAVLYANLASYLLMSAFLIGRMVKSAIVYGTWIVGFYW